MKTDSTLDPETTLAGEVDSGGCAPMPGSPSSVTEMEALELAIQHGDHEIQRVQDQLAAMQRKQCARQHELGWQKARIGLKPSSRISDEAKPGHRMVIVQTDAGIATRWIPENDQTLATADTQLTKHDESSK